MGGGAIGRSEYVKGAEGGGENNKEADFALLLRFKEVTTMVRYTMVLKYYR